MKHWNISKKLFTAMISFVVVFCFTIVVLAADSFSIYDQPSSLKTGTASNHKIVMEHFSSVDEGDTLIFTFPPSFDMSSIIEDDIDIADDDVDLTTAPNCSGSEEMSVQILAGNILTFTVCSGDGGAIATSSKIEIEIGTNASSSGTGANKIINPSDPATYYIALSGSFGDFASIPIPILSNESGSVSASVASSSSGGGGGGGTETSEDYTVVLTSPNGGETLNYGDAESVTWSGGSDIPTIDIYYSTDSGATYTSIISSESNDGSYTWTVPDVTTTTAMVRVDGMDGSATLSSDESDAVFTIIGSSIGVDYSVEVLTPNGGEDIETSSSYEITWSGASSLDSVNISYSLDNGSNYSDIAIETDNDGSYFWTAPVTESVLGLIKIEGVVSGSVFSDDESDSVFSISINDEEDDTEDEEEDDEEDDEDDEDDSDDGEDSDDDSDDAGDEDGDVDSGDESVVTEIIENIDQNKEEIPEERKFDVLITEESERIDLLSGSEINVLPGSDIVIQIKASDFKNIDDVSVIVGENIYYPIEIINGEYAMTIPMNIGDDFITIIVDYQDGEAITKVFNVESQISGYVFEKIEGVQEPVEGAIVIVYEINGGSEFQWNGGSYNQDNPVVVDSSGLISWYVPNGDYLITAGKSGYEDAEVVISVSNGILAPNIELERNEEVIVIQEDEDTALIAIDTGPKEAIVSIVKTVSETVVVAQEVLAEIREIPEVQTAATIATPVVVGSVIASAAVLSTSFNLFPLLQYLFIAPILLIARRRRENFGIIYNSYTKVPIDFAVVRLYTKAGKLVRTMVSDQEGRYFFKIDPGVYFIRVNKSGFAFPSKYLLGQNKDGKFLDLYTQGYVQISDKNAIISANIPIDPISDKKIQAPGKIIFRRFLRVLQNIIAVTGILLAIFVCFVQPGIFSFAMVGVQTVFYIATRILAKPKKKKGWGIITDANTKKPITNAIVRLFEPKYSKLLETSVTDRKGRYVFLTGPNQYFVTIEKPGFEKQEIRPIDYRNKKELTPISVDVALQKHV